MVSLYDFLQSSYYSPRRERGLQKPWFGSLQLANLRSKTIKVRNAKYSRRKHMRDRRNSTKYCNYAPNIMFRVDENLRSPEVFCMTFINFLTRRGGFFYDCQTMTFEFAVTNIMPAKIIRSIMMTQEWPICSGMFRWRRFQTTMSKWPQGITPNLLGNGLGILWDTDTDTKTKHKTCINLPWIHYDDFVIFPRNVEDLLPSNNSDKVDNRWSMTLIITVRALPTTTASTCTYSVV